jgi:hypothetical protein
MTSFRDLFAPEVKVICPVSEQARTEAEERHRRRIEKADAIFRSIEPEREALAASGIRLSQQEFVVTITCGYAMLRCFCDESDYRISLHGVNDLRSDKRPFSFVDKQSALIEIAETMKIHFPSWT